jgi:hypothetical protein
LKEKSKQVMLLVCKLLLVADVVAGQAAVTVHQLLCGGQKRVAALALCRLESLL